MTTERYDATVTSIEDPEKRLRIKVTCIGLMGDDTTELPVWVEPNLDWGWVLIPDPGEIVEIIALSGEDQDEIFGQHQIENMELRWDGTRSWTDEEVDEDIEPRPIPDDFKENYGKRRGFITPNGHMILFDDTKGKEKINFTWVQEQSDGTKKYQYMSMDEKGSLTIANKNGSMIFMNAEAGQLTVIDEHGNYYGSSKEGITIADKFQNFIQFKDGAMQIISQGNMTIMGNSVDIKSGSVNLLDGALDKVIKGDTFAKLVFDIHTHAGPGSPPVPLMSAIPLVLSQNCKVGK
jgi:hypothetical protein